MAKAGKPASARPAKDQVPVVAGSGANAPIIVGLGASAGGLEALDQFFRNVPENSGLAFVVVQHLDPHHKGMLPELLQRATAMPVVQARDHTKIKPNCVYVVPPNKDLSILHGALHVLNLIAPHGMHLPIDHFLLALAEDQRDRAVAVILSGMGTDGTLGLRAIKDKAGLAFAQNPETAKFNGMPQSAIKTGLIDIIADAKDLPERIISYLQTVRPGAHSGKLRPAGKGLTRRAASDEPAAGALAQATSVHPATDLEKIVILLRARTGNDFSLYKKSALMRRIERRMGLHKLDKLADYVRYLQENPQELDLLFKEVLIGVTSFFRDPEAWECLKKVALPELIGRYPSGKPLRAWVVGCSTGEEAYSLAIVFKEVLNELKPRGGFSLQIFATDLDPDAIARGRMGHYPASIKDVVSPQRLGHYFVEDGSGYRVAAEIREMVVFAQQKVFMDPPFTRLDILTCRNLMIYLSSRLQGKLVPLFHYALCPGGILLLGSAESLGHFSHLFNPIESKVRLYRRAEVALSDRIEFPTKHFPAASHSVEEPKVDVSQPNFQTLADQFLLQNLAPAAVLVNAAGDIIYFNGRTGKFLEPAAGKANLNIHAMAREGLRYPLAVALKEINASRGRLVLDGMQIVEGEGKTRLVNVVLQAIDEPPALRGMAMIAFTELDAAAREAEPQRRAHGSTQSEELKRAYAEVRNLREETQRVKNEFTTANEELQSMNEELQSTNEELTTSKEEMQSLIEELETINGELQARVDDLSWANSDLKNLLNSTDIATVFLDNALCVRRFTNQATDIFKLIQSDVGRPLSDITGEIDYPELQEDAREVLHSLVFIEKQIRAGAGRWYKVRITPYRTMENIIDGVVITFADITSSKLLEAELRAALATSAHAVAPASGDN